jgi:hypothetical protein
MTMMRPAEFQVRARRVYELGRLRHGVLTAWPVPLLTALSIWWCRDVEFSLAIGTCLFALVTALVWHGRVAAQAARAGVGAGVLAFAGPVVAYHLDMCGTPAAMLMINGLCGLGVGVLLSVQSFRLEVRGHVFLSWAAIVATLSGTLGCVLFGLTGLAGMALGIFLSTAPVVLYRLASP